VVKMSLEKTIVVDAKTGETKVEMREVTLTPKVPRIKPIDHEKLKAVLKAKGIITDSSEIEI